MQNAKKDQKCKNAKSAKIAEIVKIAEIPEIAESETMKFLETFKIWVFFGKIYGLSGKKLEFYSNSLNVANLL